MVDEEKVPILGLPSCRELDLVPMLIKQQLNAIVGDTEKTNLPPDFQAYHDVFTGIGYLPFEDEIKLKGNYVSVVRPSRRLPTSDFGIQ